MPQAQTEYTTYFNPKLLRHIRQTFAGSGVDNYSQPPAQNPDMFEQLTNVMPITNSGIQKRWGYTAWNTSNPLVGQHAYEFQSLAGNLRYILLAAADGTGVGSSTNNVNAYDEAGNFIGTIFTPVAGATKPFMVLSRDYAYFTDTVLGDLKKWNGSALSNWGIARPAVAPTLNVQSGVSTAWSANTVFSIMGLTVDGNGNVQQLISVNASGTNTSQVGTSGNGQPVWQGIGSTTADNTITWTNVGQVGTWKANTVYTQYTPIYDQKSGGVYVKWNTSPTTSGNVPPNFSGVPGTFANDGPSIPLINDQFWGCIGNVRNVTSGKNADIDVWHASKTYAQFDKSPAGVVEPTALPSFGEALSSTPIFLQLNLTAPGTSGTGGSPKWGTSAGDITTDGDLQWIMLSSATRANNAPVIAWTGPSAAGGFTVIKDGSGNMQVCTTGGTTAGTAPTFATGVGQTTTDGTAVWTNVGVPVTWTALTKWFLPATGFVVPSNTRSLGNTEIVDTNNNEQFVVSSGKSGASAPAWNASTGGTTTDGGITWKNNGAFVQVTGDITLTSGRNYFIAFRNANTGQISDLSPVSASTGALTNDAVILNNIDVSTDSQVTDVIVLATADGGDQTTLYYVDGVPNGTTTYTDTMPEDTLLDQNIYQETDQFGNLIGVADNQPPLAGTSPLYHRNRLYMLDGKTLLFSKALSDLLTSTGTICGRYEECWPPVFQIDISNIAETPRGLATDGTALYIGTERQVHRLLGDGPTNFGQPEVIFDEVGIVNQETWKSVFVQGQPTGMIWLTPDNRVIGSDFNTYVDIGSRIQSTLNTINTSAATNSWAMFVSSGPFDLYVLAIPTGSNTTPDTLCVYDLRGQQWFIWNLTDTLSTGVFNINASGIPQWIINAASGDTYKFTSAGFQDRQGNTPVSYATTVRTSWFSPFQASMNNALNELKVFSGDATIQVTLEAARTTADFSSPTALVSSVVPAANAFGDLAIGLISSSSKFNFFRLTFTATTTTQDFLRGYSLEVIPFSRA